MSQAERVGIFVNRMASSYYKAYAQRLSERLSVPQQEILPMPEVSDKMKTVIVVGGDGTIRTVTQAMLERNNHRVLVVIPGGSQNGFYHSLRHKNVEITMEQLLDEATSHLPIFHPGTLNGEIFNHMLDVSQAGVLQAKETERLRKTLPRKLRPYASLISALVKMQPAATTPRYEIKSFMMSPFVGPLKIFPNQNLYSEEITLMRMVAESKRETAIKLLTFLLCTRLGKKPPASVVEFTTVKSFKLEPSHLTEMNADGEVISLPKEETLYVKRHSESLRATTLKL